jgi:uncharacterized protein (TIGR02453 family)
MAKACFSGDFLRFLKDLKVHNNRDWFQENKERYEKNVRDPFLEFLTDLGPELKKIAPHYVVDARPVGGSMMRIHRDIRFSKDKSPYKTAIAAHFGRLKGEEQAPAFFLRLTPGDSGIGGGLWQPEPPVLKKVRDAIVDQPKKWQKVTSDRELRSACGFVGESLKRPPPGYDPGHPFVEDLKRKDFAMTHALSDKEVTSATFLETAVEALRSTKPFLAFLAEAVGTEL